MPPCSPEISTVLPAAVRYMPLAIMSPARFSLHSGGGFRRPCRDWGPPRLERTPPCLGPRKFYLVTIPCPGAQPVPSRGRGRRRASRLDRKIVRTSLYLFTLVHGRFYVLQHLA